MKNKPKEMQAPMQEMMTTAQSVGEMAWVLEQLVNQFKVSATPAVDGAPPKSASPARALAASSSRRSARQIFSLRESDKR
jgi:hypothetical protein